MVVDAVTTRRANLHETILALLDREVDSLPAGLSAVAYRAVASEPDVQQLLLWSAALSLGEVLPTLPLWIGPDLPVPLDLEASYQATCADLLIRDVG